MSSMWMLGRFWAPPNTVMRFWFTARFVRMLTVRSSGGRGADPVDARGGSVDEAANAGLAGDADQRLEAVVVDRPAEPRVQLEARIVRDAREVDDRPHPGGGL